MSWFFRARELADGRWDCYFGSQTLGTHPNLAVALHHLVEAAIALGGRENFSFHLHHRDGRMEIRPARDLVPGEELE